jgi:hypothetical protein
VRGHHVGRSARTRGRTGPTAPALPDHLWIGLVGPLLLLAQLCVAATCPRVVVLPTVHAAPTARHDIATAAATVSALHRCPLFRVPLRRRARGQDHQPRLARGEE